MIKLFPASIGGSSLIKAVEIDHTKDEPTIVRFGMTKLLPEAGGDALLSVETVHAGGLPALRDLDAGGENGQHQRTFELLPEMRVHLVVEAGETACVGAGHFAEIDG